MFNTRQSPCRSLTTCHRYQRCPRLVGASRCNSKQYPIYWLVMKASFRIYSIQKQTRYHILLVLFKELRPHGIRFNCFYHMAVCPFFRGQYSAHSLRQFPYTDAVAGGLRVLQCVYGISRIAVCLAWVPGSTWFGQSQISQPLPNFA